MTYMMIVSKGAPGNKNLSLCSGIFELMKNKCLELIVIVKLETKLEVELIGEICHRNYLTLSVSTCKDLLL